MTATTSAFPPIVFAPKPANDFRRFYELYYAECRWRMPRIQAIAAKWRFEDLIPGLSDYDTRFIVADGMTVHDWCDMSTAVGEVHLDLCERYPHWARNLEHLPGVNLTWNELTDPAMYYPEYPQWTFYNTEDPARLAAAGRYLADRPWGLEDRVFHLKKFCLYYGRYDRQIDPAVNLHEFESKYPLHSRLMHYFCPPLQSALCLLLKRPVAGKMETVRLACELFPDVPVFAEMRDAVDRHYEVPELYVEPGVSRLEDRLEAALDMLRGRLVPLIADIVPDAANKSVAQWKTDLARAPVNPAMKVFDSARFSRLMKGRLRFYAHAPAEHFDSTWPIENELRRLKSSFFDVPFGTFWELTTGEKVKDPAAIVTRLVPSLLTDEEARCTLDFIRLAPGHWAPGTQRQVAMEIAAVFDGFFHALNKVAQAVAARSYATRRRQAGAAPPALPGRPVLSGSAVPAVPREREMRTRKEQP